MRRKLALLVGLAAVIALVRLLRRRGASGGAGRPASTGAEELRAKLAKRRRGEGPAADDDLRTDLEAYQPAAGGGQEAAGPPASPPSAELGSEQELDVEAARERVHDEARAALEEMRRSGGL